MKIHPAIANLRMVIYIIIHRPTGYCYVGQTIQRLKNRIRQHCRDRKQFVDKIIHGEGSEKFEVGILDVCTSIAELNERERYWISYFNCKCPYGFNKTIGGADNGKDNGRNKSVVCVNTGETFKSVTDAAKRFDLSPSGVSSVCNGKLKTTGGLIFTFADNPVEGQIFLITKKSKPRQVLCLDTGEKFSTIIAASRKFGINRTGIGDVCAGKRGTAGGLKFVFADVPPNERKIFIPAKGQKRYVLCVDTGEIFESVSEVARKLNVNQSCVSNVCHGKRKTAGGLRFTFVDENK